MVEAPKSNQKRIMKETQDLLNNSPPGITIQVGEDISHFHALIQGPVGSPYEGGVFKAMIQLPEEYPMRPPKNHLATKIYHPNFDKQGRDCLDITDLQWSPALTVRHLLQSIQTLIGNMNIEDPLDAKIALNFKNNQAEAILIAREWTQKYATPSED